MHRHPPMPSLDTPPPQRDGMHRARLADGRGAWLKQRRDRPPDFLHAEADGLERLRAVHGLRIPRVLGLTASSLLLEDLGSGTRGPRFAEQAGAGLAMQHLCRGPAFGLQQPGWCGESPQDNTPDSDGHRFFAERRLLPQSRRAHQAGRLDANDMRRVEDLCARLAALVPVQPPVLLHGDLWSGNLHCCADGSPALIDAAAVHFGWAEAELAMLVLFGEPSPGFFRAYAEHALLDSGWRERAPLYNLYQLLNHLNLFGGGYLGSVRSVLARFAGKG